MYVYVYTYICIYTNAHKKTHFILAANLKAVLKAAARPHAKRHFRIKRCQWDTCVHATSRKDKIRGPFCRISSLFIGLFCKIDLQFDRSYQPKPLYTCVYATGRKDTFSHHAHALYVCAVHLQESYNCVCKNPTNMSRDAWGVWVCVPCVMSSSMEYGTWFILYVYNL